MEDGFNIAALDGSSLAIQVRSGEAEPGQVFDHKNLS
jgi:hypothetical protein